MLPTEFAFRRRFLPACALLVSTLVAPAAAELAAQTARQPGKHWSSGPNALALELEGGGCAAVLNAVNGGSALPGATGGQPSFEDFRVQVRPSGVERALGDWLVRFADGSDPAVSGAVLVSSSQARLTRRTDFSDAHMTQITVPALDRTDQNERFLTLQFHPDTVRDEFSGSQAAPMPRCSSGAYPWNASSFRMEVQGLDGRAVKRIESFTVPASLDGPILSLTLASPEGRSGPAKFGSDFARDWTRWYDNFVVRGNSSADQERSGQLILLDRNGRELPLRFILEGLQPIRLEPGYTPDAPIKMQLKSRAVRIRYQGPGA